MNKKILAFTILLSLLITIISTTVTTFAGTSAALPYTEIFGTLNGANYVIRIPNPIENWNRNLVIFCHGYSHLEVNVSTFLTSSNYGIDSIIANGYAVAASTYGDGGYCVQKGIETTYQLTQYVVSNYNVTGKVFLYGTSMGGNIALLTGQKYPEVYSGVLDLSGSKDLTDAYNTKMDFLAASNDSEMIAKLQAINAFVPPYPFSVLVPPPLSIQLYYWRAYCNQSIGDIMIECGGTPQNASQSYARDSPTGNANISIPVITVHGTSDALVPFTQSLKYQAAVAAEGRSDLYRLYLIPVGQHVPDPLIIAQLIPRLLELNAWSNTLDSRAYTDPSAVAWNVDASFSFIDLIQANHTYVPEDKVANPVQKLYISYDEKLLTCDIKVGGVTYSLGKDFTYTGHVDYIYYNPSFANPTLGYLYPSVFSGSEVTVNYMYNFSAIPGGLEGTLSMYATSKDDVSSIVSVAGTGDLQNVQVKATISPQWYDAAKMVVNIYHDGMVSGWPNAVPTFMTTNTAVTYAQLTDYCTNVWGLTSNPYPTYPANVTSEYLIFNVVIGDKFYLGVACDSLTSGVFDPVAKTVTLTYNDTWFLGDWYKGVAKMDQGFTGAVVVSLLNYRPANATATPPKLATYDMGPAMWNLQGFGALSGQSLILRADGAVLPYLAKGYAILP